ncbi:hypothetical protein HQ576_07545, partial [bacterium]|nr:hypothetical protein [bacterium]
MAKKADPKENMLRREQEQIERYREVERPRYKIYAETLHDILSGICDECGIEGIVQARAKTVASFAGKMVRRRKRTDDALHTFTDLAGARVIVNTQAEVAQIGK